MRENLKAARKEAGLTQQEVAERLGISLIGYRQIENGARIGKIETWDKLEDIFGIHQRTLRALSEEVEMTPEELAQAADSMLDALEKICLNNQLDSNTHRRLRKFLVRLDAEYCDVLTEAKVHSRPFKAEDQEGA